MSLNNFLEQLQLTENSREIYTHLFGKNPMIISELNALIPKSSAEECMAAIKELLISGLLIILTPHEPEILTYYQALPPFAPIISYFDNINSNLGNIKDTIQNLITNTINKVFQGNEEIEIDTIFNSIQNVINDINEDTIIQKQEVADIIESMEVLNEITGIILGLKKNVKGTMQTQFSNLLKSFSKTKNKIIKKIQGLELKKVEEQVVNIVEEEFKRKSDKLVAYFATSIQDEIEEKFEEIKDPLDKTIDSLLDSRKEFSTILSGMITNFEVKMNKSFEIIKNKKDIFSDGLELLENQVNANLDAIIHSSIDQVAALSKPMEAVMQQYLEKVRTTNKMSIKNTWNITSRTKIAAEIKNLITSSKESITFIIPKIEDYISMDDLQNLAPNMRIRVASSDPSTNSRVKKLMEIKGLEHHNLPNENVVILKGDNRYIIVSVIFNDSKDPLNNVLGIGCNSEPLNNVFNALIEKFWSAGKIDAFKGVSKQVSRSTPSKQTNSTYISQFKAKKHDMPIKFELPETAQEPDITPHQPAPIQPLSSELKSQLNQQTEETLQSEETPPVEEVIQAEKTINGEFISKVVPKAGDQDGILINDAFNTLLQKINTAKGVDFSIELQAIADLVLERRGFSVTLHKLRSCINKFKENEVIFTESEKQEIFAEMEEWKQHLL